MGIGRFRTRAEFSIRDTSTDSFGQPSQTYTLIRTEGVEVQQLSGNDRQRFTQGVATDEEFISVRARYSPGLDEMPSSARITIKDAEYEIAGKSLLDFRQQYIDFVIRRVR